MKESDIYFIEMLCDGVAPFDMHTVLKDHVAPVTCPQCKEPAKLLDAGLSAFIYDGKPRIRYEYTFLCAENPHCPSKPRARIYAWDSGPDYPYQSGQIAIDEQWNSPKVEVRSQAISTLKLLGWRHAATDRQALMDMTKPAGILTRLMRAGGEAGERGDRQDESWDDFLGRIVKEVRYEAKTLHLDDNDRRINAGVEFGVYHAIDCQPGRLPQASSFEMREWWHRWLDMRDYRTRTIAKQMEINSRMLRCDPYDQRMTQRFAEWTAGNPEFIDE